MLLDWRGICANVYTFSRLRRSTPFHGPSLHLLQLRPNAQRRCAARAYTRRLWKFRQEKGERIRQLGRTKAGGGGQSESGGTGEGGGTGKGGGGVDDFSRGPADSRELGHSNAQASAGRCAEAKGYHHQPRRTVILRTHNHCAFTFFVVNFTLPAREFQPPTGHRRGSRRRRL